MEKSFEKYKGIHPGKVLSRILEPTGTKKAEFARHVGTYPQTLNEILKGNRKLPVDLSLRIDHALGYSEGTFAELQTYFDIKKAKIKMSEYHPDLDKIRPIVFWDTDLNNINFEIQKKGIIERILERGDQQEKEVIFDFYGEKIIKSYFKQYLDFLKINSTRNVDALSGEDLKFAFTHWVNEDRVYTARVDDDAL
jgi:addiction module HigA family antidote